MTAVREYPLGMSWPMIEASKARAKSQTRRLYGLERINQRPDEWLNPRWLGKNNPRTWMFEGRGSRLGLTTCAVCPYGDVGDRLWFRELFLPCRGTGERCSPSDARYVCFFDGHQKFRADGSVSGWTGEPPRWEKHQRFSPWIHMPRWASRWLVELTEVRPERLQCIIPGDAIDEGVDVAATEHEKALAAEVACSTGESVHVVLFRLIWQKLHADGLLWDDNPWDWALTFKILEGPTS